MHAWIIPLSDSFCTAHTYGHRCFEDNDKRKIKIKIHTKISLKEMYYIGAHNIKKST